MSIRKATRTEIKNHLRDQGYTDIIVHQHTEITGRRDPDYEPGCSHERIFLGYVSEYSVSPDGTMWRS